MKEIKGILFDMDGVLVESEPAHADSWFNIMKSRGINLSDGLIKLENYIGASDLDVVRDLKKFYPNRFPEEPLTLLKLKVDYFLHTLKKGHLKLPVPKGRNQFLKLLKERGVKIAVVSSCSRAEIEATLINQKIIDLFEFFIGVDEVEKPKPDPGPYLKGLSKLNLAKEEVIVIEDSVSGITAARTGGFKTLGMATSFDHLEQFKEVTFYKNYLEIMKLWE